MSLPSDPEHKGKQKHHNTPDRALPPVQEMLMLREHTPIQAKFQQRPGKVSQFGVIVGYEGQWRHSDWAEDKGNEHYHDTPHLLAAPDWCSRVQDTLCIIDGIILSCGKTLKI